MVYMLTWLGHIDGKRYHIWHTYGSVMGMKLPHFFLGLCSTRIEKLSVSWKHHLVGSPFLPEACDEKISPFSNGCPTYFHMHKAARFPAKNLQCSQNMLSMSMCFLLFFSGSRYFPMKTNRCYWRSVHLGNAPWKPRFQKDADTRWSLKELVNGCSALLNMVYLVLIYTQ